MAVGIYTDSSIGNIVSALTQMMRSTLGFIMILLVPVSLLVLSLVHSFAKDLQLSLLELDVVEEKRKLTDEVCIKNKIGYRMDKKTKYKVLCQASEDEKLYLTSNVYNISETYIERVKPNTTVRDFFGNLDTNGNMVVYDKDNQAVSEDALVGTGMTLVDTRNDERIDKTIYVVGDLDGNGKISLVDLSLLNQSLVKKTVLSEVQSKAADLNNDGKVSLLDLSLINQVLTGKMNTSDLP